MPNRTMVSLKIKLLVLLLAICAFGYGQDYKSSINNADELYRQKDYKASVLAYRAAFKIQQKHPEDLYNAACAAALAGNKKLAFDWLDLALAAGWVNVGHLQSDQDLVALHQSKKWAPLLSKMQHAVDQIEANYDKPLQARLIKVYEDDQAIRRAFVAGQKEWGNESPQVDSLGKLMMGIDSSNTVIVTEILDEYGWVGADKVGGQANHALFLVIQHADLSTQQKYLPMMREAVKQKHASASTLALLEDRVALGAGRRQIYGSQIGYDKATGKSFVLPLDEPEQVDQRRAEVGLGPFADYVQRWGIIWDPAAYRQQLPEIEARQAQEK